MSSAYTTTCQRSKQLGRLLTYMKKKERSKDASFGVLQTQTSCWGEWQFSTGVTWYRLSRYEANSYTIWELQCQTKIAGILPPNAVFYFYVFVLFFILIPLAHLLVLSMLFIAVNSPNLAHQHWLGKRTIKYANNFYWDYFNTEVGGCMAHLRGTSKTCVI